MTQPSRVSFHAAFATLDLICPYGTWGSRGGAASRGHLCEALVRPLIEA
jgi:hypothetical protein